MASGILPQSLYDLVMGLMAERPEEAGAQAGNTAYEIVALTAPIFPLPSDQHTALLTRVISSRLAEFHGPNDNMPTDLLSPLYVPSSSSPRTTRLTNFLCGRSVDGGSPTGSMAREFIAATALYVVHLPSSIRPM